ncbi:MAG TPA: hypothetical protein VGQ87_02620 [Patescibacteria group bacterium]|jgi:Tfp pilus assembly protein PilO|nr:hypothetical protein [Patescibacteria group bacterium]
MFTEKQLLYKIIRNLSLLGVVFVLSLIITGLIGRQITKISNSVYQKQKLASVLEKRSENLIRLSDDLKRVDDADQKINDAFPTSDNILDFVSAMEKVAMENSIKQSIRFGSAAPIPAVSENLQFSALDYTLTLTGDIKLLTSYLRDFEKLPFVTSISSITVNSSNGWTNESQIGIQAKVYIKSR